MKFGILENLCDGHERLEMEIAFILASYEAKCRVNDFTGLIPYDPRLIPYEYDIENARPIDNEMRDRVGNCYSRIE